MFERLPSGLVDASSEPRRPAVGATPRPSAQTALRELFFGTRRQVITILATTAVASLLGASYLAIAPARYSAAALLLLDTQRTRSPLDAPNAVVDSSAVASQIETLKSETLARAVIDKLGLATDPEFLEADLVARLRDFIEPDAKYLGGSRQRRDRRVLERFASALDVFLAGRSYAAVIRFTSKDPEKAARIANAISEAYIDDQLEARTAGSTRANLWFQRRLDELKAQADQAERAREDAVSDGSAESDAARTARLNDLTIAAQARKRAYESFRSLGSYSRAIEQQALPATEARVLTWAEAPLVRSWPPAALLLVLSAVVGGAMGALFAYAREHLGGTVRSRQSLERNSNLPCLSFFPLLKRRWRRKSLSLWPRYPRQKGIMVAGDSDPACASEALVALKIALDAARHRGAGSALVGIVSAHSGEGKTTLAFNLAKSMADSGRRVLLVDADLHDLSLTRELAPPSDRSLSGALRDPASLENLAPVPGLGFSIVGQSLAGVPQRPADLLSSREMREMLDVARSRFDHVLLDLPGVLEHVDASAVAVQVDVFVVVAQWGRTRLADLEALAARSDRIAGRTLGIFVNKVPRGSGWF